MALSDDLATAATIGVLGLVGLRLVSALRLSTRRSGRAVLVEVWRGVRWRHVWPVPFVLAITIAVASALVQIPGLDWGWWTAIGGQGNPISGTTDQTIGTVWEWLIPLVFVTLLLPALPLFALAEERTFRAGAETWSGRGRLLMCVKFGLVHALIGIPIGVALALTVGGGYFTWVYLRAVRTGARRHEATLESTRAHVVYNLVIVLLVAVYALLVALDA